MGLRLLDKVAVITGAGGGIGSEMARLFAAEGASVVANDIRAAPVTAVAESIVAHGGKAIAVEESFTEQCQHCEDLAQRIVVPQVIGPLAAAIAAAG